ncbi:MAG TPA: FAD-binding protein, partial [Myxococcota bacterium]|nr:FAD-binding protein [Myxococcota bacterium]
MARRKFWGWGNEGDGPNEDQARGIAKTLGARFAVPVELAPEPRLEDLALPKPRVAPPPALADRCSVDPHARASHTYGKSYRDIVRGARGDFAVAPDFVAFPRDEADVAALLYWCGERGVAAIPYGGGSSVVGGVE